MKQSITTNNDGFEPITLHIKMESQAEVDAMYSMFNHAAITDPLEKFGIDFTGLRELLPQKNYRESWDVLDKSIRKLK